MLLATDRRGPYRPGASGWLRAGLEDLFEGDVVPPELAPGHPTHHRGEELVEAGWTHHEPEVDFGCVSPACKSVGPFDWDQAGGRTEDKARKGYSVDGTTGRLSFIAPDRKP